MQWVHAMPARTDEREAEELLSHARWIRELAARLVRDPSVAEDLVQDTWAAALTHRPKADRPLRPWLGTVLRNFARRRGLKRVEQEVEESTAKAERADPADVCEGIETARFLTEEVARLDEPYRSVLFLRYYRDLAPVEIARHLELPPATVRSQLKRGIERLRARLDQRFGGDRDSWCVLLAPFVRPKVAAASSASVPAVATTGVLVMNASLKIGAALAAVVVAYMGLSLTGTLPSPLSSSGGPVAASEATEHTVATASMPAAIEGNAAPDERRSVEPTDPPVPEPVPTAAANPTVVEAVIVDERGFGLVGAQMRTVLDEGPRGRATSVAGGLVRLELEGLGDRPERVLLEAAAPGFASLVEPLTIGSGEQVHLGTLELSPGGSISGIVVDERGLGIEGARVSSTKTGVATMDMESQRYQRTERGAFAEADAPEALTDSTGAFTLAGLPEAHVRLWVDASEHISSYSEPVEVRAGQDSAGIEVSLEAIGPDNSIEGVVLDPFGEPLPHADLDYEHRSLDLRFSFHTRKQADANGAFRFALGSRSVLTLTAYDPEGRYGLATSGELEPGTRDVVLRLFDGRDVELVAVGEQGQHLEDFTFMVLDAAGEAFLQGGQSEDGAAHLRVPQQDFQVVVSARHHTRETTGTLSPDTAPESLEVRLHSVPGVHGRVVAGGAAVSGAAVRLHRLVRDEVRYEHLGARCWLVPQALDQQTSDIAGEFHVTVRDPGEYVLQVEHDGFALGEWGPFSVGADLHSDPVEIGLGQGGAIEGRVTLPHGADPTGTLVAAHRGDGRGRTARVGADGLFRFELLAPGPWNVAVRGDDTVTRSHGTSPAVNRYEQEVDWNCQVAVDHTTYHDLAIADPHSFVLQGRVRVEGVPSPSFTAFLCAPGEDFYSSRGGWTTVTPDNDGHFELGVAEAGEYRLVLRRSADGEEWLILDELLVDADAAPWELELETGSVEIHGIDPASFDQDIPPFVFRWRGRSGVLFMAMTMPTTETTELRVVPAGTGQLVLPSMQKMLDPGDWETAREMEIRRGETTRVQAP